MTDYNEILTTMINAFLRAVGYLAIFNLIVIIIFLFFHKHEVAKKIIALFGVSTIILGIATVWIVLPRVRDVKNDSFVVVENAKLQYNNDDGFTLGSGSLYCSNGETIDVNGLDYFSFSNPDPDSLVYGTFVYGKYSKQLIYVEQTKEDKEKGTTITLGLG